MKVTFSAEGSQQPTDATNDTRQPIDQPAALGDPKAVGLTALDHYPVDALLIEENVKPTQGARYWESRLTPCPMIKRPTLVATRAAQGAQLRGREDFMGGSGWRARFAALGYSPSFWHLKNTDFRGLVPSQERLFAMLQKHNSAQPGHGLLLPPGPDSATRGAMNMLKTRL